VMRALELNDSLDCFAMVGGGQGRVETVREMRAEKAEKEDACTVSVSPECQEHSLVFFSLISMSI
jgi:hypothetical protein